LFDKSIASGKAFWYGGPEEEAFCQQFAKFMGGGYADAVNSGTTAIYVALRSLNIEPFTEVIVSPITDPGGIMPITMLNCIPVVADTAPGSFNVGPEQIEKMISPLTSAIVVAHLHGEPADMNGIMRIARKHHIPVVEDCAQSHFTTINGRLAGTFGAVAAFSTMSGKHFCTGGQGGVVYTRNEATYKWARRYSDRGKPFGLPAGATNCVATLNYNLNDLSAVIGSAQLKKLPGIVNRRRQIVKWLEKGLREIKAVSFPPMIKGANPSYWHLRLRFQPEAVSCNKETYCKALAAEGLGTIVNYNAMPHTFDWFKNKSVFGTSKLPWSSPLYKGNPNRQFACPNAVAAIRDHFLLAIFESWGKREADDLIAIFKKLEMVFSKRNQ
ncbi:MAG: DegT/DnrJ/EryC1/StrS family aminotransferase, partial [Kiritimatiellia bacterium]|nr:DegT/DnrJ/EryC1/StrS family aminotransferase [Kiritimatiellia bacterium]